MKMNRTKRINFWLSEKYRDKLERQAHEAKLSQSDYIRKLIRDAEVLSTPDVDYLAYAGEFKRLGERFNEYVKEYNATGILDRDGAELVWLQIKETADRLRNELIDKTVKLEVETSHDKK